MMRHRDPNRYADRIVFWICSALLFVFYTQAVYELGSTHGKAEPRKCASVQGQQVVSTTAETCTYANSFGRATTKRRAG